MISVLMVAFVFAVGLSPVWIGSILDWRHRKRAEYEYWLTCDPERHADWELLSEAMETQFTNTGMTKTKMELLGSSVWRVKA